MSNRKNTKTLTSTNKNTEFVPASFILQTDAQSTQNTMEIDYIKQYSPRKKTQSEKPIISSSKADENNTNPNHIIKIIKDVSTKLN